MTFKILTLLTISTLFVSVLCLAPGSDVKECSLLPDFVPDSIRECTSNVPISCKGSTVCYKYTDTLYSIPCIVDVYGLQGLIKMNRCGTTIEYVLKSGGVVCIEEEELRKFYKCFGKE